MFSDWGQPKPEIDDEMIMQMALIVGRGGKIRMVGGSWHNYFQEFGTFKRYVELPKQVATAGDIWEGNFPAEVYELQACQTLRGTVFAEYVLFDSDIEYAPSHLSNI